MMVVIGTFSVLDWIMGGLPIPTAQQLLGLFRNFGFGFGKVVASTGDVSDVFGRQLLRRNYHGPLFEQPQSPMAFTLTCMAMMAVGVTISAFTYRYVEEPFLKKCKHNTI